jgi:hypothetical protein
LYDKESGEKMKSKIATGLLVVAGLFFVLGAAGPYPQCAYDEARVRYILADISLGGSIGYYRGFPDNPNAHEALRRWQRGVRVVNLDQFERPFEDGGFGIVYVGTCDLIDGLDVDLNTDYETGYYQAPEPRCVVSYVNVHTRTTHLHNSLYHQPSHHPPPPHNPPNNPPPNNPPPHNPPSQDPVRPGAQTPEPIPGSEPPVRGNRDIPDTDDEMIKRVARP